LQPFLSVCAKNREQGILSKDKQPRTEKPDSSKTILEQPATGNLNGAAIIDDQGREVPITESMLVDALDKIVNSEPVKPTNDNSKPDNLKPDNSNKAQ
jgi:hypothetical protein